ncbi:hypothetical protein PHYBLDRAFT_68470 [Phycomyces blakesleeanus NRRL 1555(-)]|uniref:Uncharacterized protein n=1 Tax=Phycomyces blakesleeanus (strain ATCC 8743b / DSM 1359 / FGSC 10004 / NBRC 33097 / NRRL 1555) TaxID=763407 RepID=A0A167PIT0_PHYB8|nr:hypothetical protein PHYBLDRAFT_68470 [Phycomyces blakesleeanus NRRL 1555(-)]OAD78028.1 hypothetical protein PHYBLDRAFT_68470 [Phycomyces blakesleeanus NRRL 1555(-)]|eukprot:XP_018296068.1 hypothetical protein PHYBLDRAFT_68470 [Phycomyces blakesleeanus NRRL 1555(-)]
MPKLGVNLNLQRQTLRLMLELWGSDVGDVWRKIRRDARVQREREERAGHVEDMKKKFSLLFLSTSLPSQKQYRKTKILGLHKNYKYKNWLALMSNDPNSKF